MATTGSKIFLLYLLFMYGAQSVLSFAFTSYYQQDYNGYSDGLIWKTGLMLFIGIAIYFGQSLFSRRMRMKNRPEHDMRLAALLTRRVRVAFAVVFIGLSLPFGYEYGFSFFHSGLYLSDLPFWVILLQVMKPLARLDLAYCIIKITRGEKLNNADLFVTLAYTIGGTISLAGAVDVLFLALGVLLLYGRGRIVMRSLVASPRNPKGGRRWLVYILLAASLPGAAIIGFANKIGFERTYELISNESLLTESFIVPLVLRVSSSHGSFIANAELPASLSEQVESVSLPLENMIWRSCILFSLGECGFRADITHIARLNYSRTFWDQSPLKAGATPGLLASALYIPFLPLAIVLLSYYCSLFTGGINRVIGQNRASFMGMMVLLLFTYPAFENPIDLIVIFDPAFVYNIGLLFVFKSFASARPVSSQVPAGRLLQTNGFGLALADRPLRQGSGDVRF